jgi:hypothetical protein
MGSVGERGLFVGFFDSENPCGGKMPAGSPIAEMFSILSLPAQ